MFCDIAEGQHKPLVEHMAQHHFARAVAFLVYAEVMCSVSRSYHTTSIWSKYNNKRIDVLAPVSVVAASNIAIPSFKHVICSPRTPSRTSSWQQNSHPANEHQSSLSSSRLDKAIRLNAYLCLLSTCSWLEFMLHYSEHVKKLQVFVLQVSDMAAPVGENG
jgi:hypothetical protein